MTARYRLIDHTADFGLEIFSDDVTALFEQAALALFDQLAVPVASEGGLDHCVDVSGDDWPDLMVNWLRELLYMFNGEQKIVYRAVVSSIAQTRLSAVVSYVDYLPGHHEVRNEIKAVTYHQVAAGPQGDGWQARIIFDV